MNKDNVDKFLLSHTVEVEDNGFSDRVMQSLPANIDRQRRLGRIWNITCLVMLAYFCWQTDVLSKLWVDIQVFFQLLPLHLNDVSVWYTLALVFIGLYGLVFMGGKKLASL